MARMNQTPPKAFGLKGAMPIAAGTFVATSLASFAATFTSAAWISALLFISAISLLSLQRPTKGYGYIAFVVVAFGTPATFYSIDRLENQAQREAFLAHRAMIGCREADKYLYWGEDAASLGGRPAPTDETLARCTGNDEDANPVSEFRFLIEREGLLGARRSP